MSAKPSPPRPYRDFLTPALHKRFTNAALLTLGVCYLEAVWFGQWDIFWQWFPFGPAGLRTSLLFTSVLSIFILRIAQLHIGPRTTTSQVNTFLQYLLNWPFQIVNSLLWYCISAWIFGETYIWSASSSAKLSMVEVGKSYERPRLNERPMYLRAVFISIGVMQAFWHLYYDYDRVKFPQGQNAVDGVLQPTGITVMVNRLKDQIRKNTPLLPLRAGASLIIGSIFYGLFLRQTIWNWTFTFAKTWHSLAKNSRLSAVPPQLPDLVGRAFVESILMLLLWDFANLSFDLYVAESPMKKGSPLTDSSTDPNHSLIAGLKAKKEVTRNFAFRELLIITHNIEARRRAIFRDINRPTGSTWSQILTICLGELHAMTKRIQDFQQLSAPQQQQGGQTQQQQGSSQLPRISAPLKQDPILVPVPPATSRYQRAEQQLASITASAAKSLSTPHSPSDNNSTAADPTKLLRDPARKLLTQGADSLGLSKETQATLAHPTAPVTTVVNSYLLAFLRSPFGPPFRQTFAARAIAVVTGAPYGAHTPLLASISSLSRLAIASLKEDEYGTVSKDVANIIRTFTAAENGIVRFVSALQPHWTDVEFDDDRKVEEVEDVLKALREGLKGLVNEFGEFADELGLGMGEIRAAKEVVGRGVVKEKQPEKEKKKEEAGARQENGRGDGGQQQKGQDKQKEMAEKRDRGTRQDGGSRERERRTVEGRGERGAGARSNGNAHQQQRQR